MAASNYYENTRPEMAGFLPDDYRRVLEVGCGAAEFRAHLTRPHEYWGIEPSAAAAIAQPRADRVFRGTYDDVHAELPEAYFDLVVCNDVIEHMDDVDGFLERIRTRMAPGGALVGSIPNVRFVINLVELLVRRDWEYRDEGILDRTHLRFFTEKSLRRLLAAHRYGIERLEGINPLATHPFGAKALAKRLLVGTLGADTRYLQFGFRARPASSLAAR